MISEIQKKKRETRKQLEHTVDSLVSGNFDEANQISVLLNEIFHDPFFDANKDLFYKLLKHLEVSVPKQVINFYSDAIIKQENIVETASILARKIHYGQVDKGGKDYYKEHLLHVAQMGDNWLDKVVGYLHDAAEDTNYSTDDIIQILKDGSNGQLLDIDAKIIKDALDLLNSKTAFSRKEYIERLKNNDIAIRVKLNDLYHNMDLSRIKKPTQMDIERVAKYKEEYFDILTCVIPYL